jgi:hypothetical protein
MFKSSNPVSGQSGAEEMCNLYLMYYTLSDRDDFKICFDEEDRALSWKLPEGKSSRIEQPWVPSQHPPTQCNLRGGRLIK